MRTALRLGVMILLLVFTALAQAQTVPTWTLLGPSGGSPTARFGHSGVYDPASNQMIIFAGFDGAYKNDVWVLTDANGLNGPPVWILLAPSGGPPVGRQLHSAVYDSASNRMIVFGGFDGFSYRNDVWVLTNANGIGGTPTWIALAPSGGPPSARRSHSAIYDSASNRMVLFGGYDGFPKNDVWVLTNANGLGGTPTWMMLAPSGGPPFGRDGHRAVYDPASNRMLVFGGYSLNDVWVLANATGLGGTPNWILLSPTGGPPTARQHHTAVYDSASNRMTVFGGQSPGDYHNDVWVLTDANGLGSTPTWALLYSNGGPPSQRDKHSAIYDAASNRMAVFGGVGFGAGSSAYKNDVWVLSNANVIIEITVAIDIFPNNPANVIPKNSQGSVPVVILSSPTFDAPAAVNKASMTFGRTGYEPSLAFCMGGPVDFNKDGLLDLECRFYAQKTGFQSGDTIGILRGFTNTGIPFRGTDSVSIK